MFAMALAKEISSPAPSSTTTTTPTKATTSPSVRAAENRSSPSAMARASVIAGAVDTITDAVPEVVNRSPSLSAMW